MDLPKAAYEGYAGWLAQSTPQRILPAWEDLSPGVRQAWGAAWMAAKRHEARSILEDQPAWWVHGPGPEPK